MKQRIGRSRLVKWSIVRIFTYVNATNRWMSLSAHTDHIQILQRTFNTLVKMKAKQKMSWSAHAHVHQLHINNKKLQMLLTTMQSNHFYCETVPFWDSELTATNSSAQFVKSQVLNQAFYCRFFTCYCWLIFVLIFHRFNKMEPTVLSYFIQWN